MIPLGMGMPTASQPTPEMVAKLGFVKWCVILTYACAVGRWIAHDPMGALNDVFGGLFGIFLLREDPTLQSCYSCLHASPLGAMSDGGLTCLVPYMFMTTLNGIFSAYQVYRLLERFGTLFPCNTKVICWLPSWLCLSATAQLIAVSCCWQVYKMMQVQSHGTYANVGDLELQQQQQQQQEQQERSAGVHSGASAETPASGAVHLMHDGRSATFFPFRGQGHRMVDSTE
mmetsp:Transcript_23780/g.46232  ORF Transcript_23780/g.46232 Transcript_23780/m.46232 type:complete len:229 (-) Transcript_23780:133-819(-)